jgi:L-alanine-DL-glutamate epimerase-like enolase superfamily enzyme
MRKVTAIEVLTANLPFRFSFGHALAERSETTNVYVRLTLDDGAVGFGEGVPREYVTGETLEAATSALTIRYAPPLVGRELESLDDVPRTIDEATADDGELAPSARCALELALLDAAGHAFGQPAADVLERDRASVVHYDAVIPFSSPKKLFAVALVVRALGMRNVKVKVGDDLDYDDRTLRRMLGRGVDLRVDANCAWNAEQALRAIERLRRHRISAVEQPLPGEDFEGMCRVTAETPELIIADESLRTPEEARALAAERGCDAFNIRVSKCGGLLRSMEIARIAREHGLVNVVGAQVGESGILSAAGRHLAAAIRDPRYVEGSAGRLLLKEDLTEENVLPGRRGRATPFAGPGLGVHVREDLLRARGRVEAVLEASPVRAA